MRSTLLLVLAIGAAYGSGCSQLAGLTIPLTSVTAATEEQSQDGRSYCRVLITASPVVDSEIHVEIWLPDPERWNRKFLGTGNGGYSSQFSYGEMREALAKGYAAAGSDTGHTGGDLQFAVGHPSGRLTSCIDRSRLAYADSTLGFVSAIDPDLSRFQRAGGKLLIYQGWADPVVPPEDTIRYFEELGRSMGGLTRTATFVRLFMVPGMGHCRGGPGPDTFDPVEAVNDWVENGHAPDRIVATHSTNKVVDRSRPLCSYPRHSVWTGQGSTDDARNFVCSAALKQQ